MRCRVDTEREAAHHIEARCRERFGEFLGRAQSCGGRVAAADHRQRRRVQQRRVALAEENDRGVGQLEERTRIIRIVPREQTITGGCRPCHCRCDRRGRDFPKSAHNRRGNERSQRRRRCIDHRFGRTERFKERVQQSGRQPLTMRQPDPGLEPRFLGYGLRTQSPISTCLVVLRTSAYDTRSNTRNTNTSPMRSSGSASVRLSGWKVYGFF